MKTKTLCCLSFLPSSFFQNLLELIDAFVNPFDFFWLYLLWHQKLLYLVAPFMGKQVLKRQRPDGLVTAGLPGQSIYIICSPLMLQHIKLSSVIASLNWLVCFFLELIWLLLEPIRLLLELFRLLFELIRLLLELLRLLLELIRLLLELIRLFLELIWLLLELIRLLLELILLDLLWHQKVSYLVASNS